MFTTDRFTLKPIDKEDTRFIMDLRNNSAVSQHFFSDLPLYQHEHIQWLSKQKDILDFIIISNSGDKVGRITISNIDYRHFKAEYGIMISPKYQRDGFAYLASKLLISHIFTNLPIKKISLQVFEDNKAAISLYKKLGFEVEGVLKNEYFKNGTFRNVVLMAIFNIDLQIKLCS